MLVVRVCQNNNNQVADKRNFCFKFNFFKEKSPTLIGVDITSAAIKMVELSRDGNGHYTLDAYVISPIAKQNDRTELLIFVTPKIMDDSLSLR